MTAKPLKLLSASVVERLASAVPANLERYLNNGFADLAQETGWQIETSLARWDPAIASKLDPAGGTEAEIRNSLLIFNGLEGVTPAFAREERLWARLCHIECLDFARKRWLQGTGDLQGDVRRHFFAPGLTGCRDDNAIGRLWWNGHAASLASPDNIRLGLERLLSRANIRLQIVDRADTAFRQPLIQGIFRLLGSESWIGSKDANVNDFMFEVNKRSGSIIFEALPDSAIDLHLATCLNHAKQGRA